MTPQPILHTFSISHFSEKARWGLDWAGVPYRLEPTIPFLHMRNARRLKVPGTSVPILERPGQSAIQGSSAILDWAETQGTGLLPTGTDLEQRLDTKVGPRIIAYFYSEAAIETPREIPPLFMTDLSPMKSMAFRTFWPLIRRLMIVGMRLGPERRARARDHLLHELDWLDSLLRDGREYLGGDAPNRADLTAAALLAPVALPPEHPVYKGLKPPPLMAADCDDWANRPSMAHVRRMYARHRQPQR
ncbi:MAG: glutathione S-transferase N-terminal domain-containing protein [Pseudomonadota bacterium]